MQAIPFRNQYNFFLKDLINSEYNNEFLKGTNIIARFILDKEYN